MSKNGEIKEFYSWKEIKSDDPLPDKGFHKTMKCATEEVKSAYKLCC